MKRIPVLWNFLKWVQTRAFRVRFGLWFLNIIIQKIFRVNGDSPWMVHYTSRVMHPQNIKIGEGVWFSFAVSGGCYIQGTNGLNIGNHTIFAWGVKIISANHDPSNNSKWVKAEPIEIGENCWIGVNAVILPGVKLGNSCVVAAGAVVTKSFPEKSIIAGVPAKLIGKNILYDET